MRPAVRLFDRVLATIAATAGEGASAPAEACGGAETYYRWLMGCLDGIENDLPQITRCAEAAARVHVGGGAIGIAGDTSFVYEGFGRSGGLMSLATQRPDMRIRLTGLVDAGAYKGAGPSATKDSDGWVHIGFGNRRVLERALAGGAPFDFAVHNHSAEHNGLFPAGDGTWVVPTVQNANVVALWVWTGEFAAACTRLGKMPLMFQGFAAGGKERALRLGCPEVLTGDGGGSKKLFHDKPPKPVAAGVAGREYLRQLRAILKRVHDLEMEDIRRAAAVAAEARQKGHVFYLVPDGGHAFFYQGRPCNTNYWVLPGKKTHWENWTNPAKDVFQTGDAVLYVGYLSVNTRHVDTVRAAGATFMASFSSIAGSRDDSGPPGNRGMRPDELLIDQHWPFGDAAVQFPGYDIRILPPSGVIGEAIIQMVTSELHTLLTARRRPLPSQSRIRPSPVKAGSGPGAA